MRKQIFLSMVVLGCLVASPARAGCTSISTANYTIKEPGAYCLAANMVATRNGVVIAADNVDLDCGGYTIDGSGQAASNTNRGVVGYSRTGVTVRNCTTKGFIEGIRLTGDGNSIHDNVVIAPLSRGIVVEGEESIVDGNRISDVGGTTNYPWGYFGIRVIGSATIRSNVVSGVVADAESGNNVYGIYTSGNDAGVIQGNIIRNVLVGENGRIAMGVTAHNSTNAVLKENILINPPNYHGYALYCSGAGSVSNGNIFEGYEYGVTSACVGVPAE